LFGSLQLKFIPQMVVSFSLHFSNLQKEGGCHVFSLLDQLLKFKKLNNKEYQNNTLMTPHD
jgi:hypothetical protein